MNDIILLSIGNGKQTTIKMIKFDITSGERFTVGRQNDTPTCDNCYVREVRLQSVTTF